jgi:hypothetical protein
MERETEAHDINHGEHSANDQPAIDWTAYHTDTPKLTLRKQHEARQNSTKTVNN